MAADDILPGPDTFDPNAAIAAIYANHGAGGPPMAPSDASRRVAESNQNADAEAAAVKLYQSQGGSKGILDTSFQQLPTNEKPTAAIWNPNNPVGTEDVNARPGFLSRAGTFLRAMDEAAGFDTTAISGTPAPARADNPWASTIGEAVGKAAGVVGGVGKGLSFGLGPLVDTALSTPGQQLNQLPQQKFEANYPGLQTGAEIAGALPTGAIGEAALAKAIPPVLNPSLIGRVGNVATQTARGGIVGGTAGAGMNEQDPASGAISGAMAGAAIPLALGLSGIAVRPGFDAVAARLFPGAASEQATAKVAQAFNRDLITPAEAQAALTRLGPLGGLIDVGGPNVRGLGEAVASKPGVGQQVAEDFLNTRAEGAPSRINAAINVATSDPGNFHATITDLDNARRAAASPKYEAAFSRIVPTPQEAAQVQPFISDPIGQQALNKGLRIIELEKLAQGQSFNPADYGVTRSQDGTFVLGDGVPNLRLMDAVKRGYDVSVEEARDSVTGKLSPMGRAINQARAAYTGQLRDMYPRYGGALDAWGGPSASMDAVRMGRDVLSEDPEMTSAAIAKLSPGDRAFFQAGVARAIKDRANATPDGADTTRRIFGNQLIRDRIAAGFGDPAAFQQFSDAMQNEATFAQTKNAVLSGSPTARRLAAQQDMDYVRPAMIAMGGHPLPAAVDLLRQVGRAGTGIDTNPVQTAAAQQLFSQPGAEYFAGLQRLQNRQMTPFARVPLGIGGAVAASQPPRRGLLNQ
jgi:hypothetical protein